MADPINTFRTPLYGDKDAKLHNFRQKQRPPRAFLELVNDDKKSMEYCPVNGVPLEEWDEPVQPLSDKAKQEYSNRKERKREKKEAAAKGAMLKKRRVREKLSHPPGGGPPIPQPDAVVDAPGTPLPVPDTPTTQPSTPSDWRAPSTALPQAMAQVHSASPALVPGVQPPPSVSTAPTANHSYQSIPATTESLQEPTTRSSHFDTSRAAYAMIYCPSRGQESVSGTPLSDLSNAAGLYPPGSAYTPKSPTTRHMIPEASHAARAYRPQVATQACVASHQSPLPARRWQAAPASATLNSYRSTPIPLTEFRQHAVSVSHPQVHAVPQRPHAPANTLSSAPAYATPSPLTSHAKRYGGSLPPPSSSTWAETPGSGATLSSAHTATRLNPRQTVVGDSMRDTDYFPIGAYQSLTHFSPVGTRMAMPTTRPAPIEYHHLNTMQQTSNRGAPQVNPTTTDNTLAGVPQHSAEKRSWHDAAQAAQSASLPQGKDWSVPSAVPSYTGRQQSGIIEKVENGRYAYHPRAGTQNAPAPPQAIVNVDACPPKHSAYSELSHALDLPTHTATNERAHPTTEVFATGPRIIVPPKVNVAFYAHSSNNAGCAALPPVASPYTQGIVTNKAVSDRNTLLWSQSGYVPPQYPVTNYHYPTLSSNGVGSTHSLTHINSQWSSSAM